MSGSPDISPSSVSTAGYEDGLGRRSVRFNREVGGMLECLHLRPQFLVFESALRARAEELTRLDDERFARVRGFEREGGGLCVVSELVAGHRLIDVLETRHANEAAVSGIDAAFGFLLQAMPGLAELHATSITHGTVAPGRIIVTPNSQVVLLDNIYGPAVERLNLNRRTLWKSFGIMTAPVAGAVQIDHHTDVTQVALCALLLASGRSFDEAAEVATLGLLVREVTELAEIRAGKNFAEGVGRFFKATLPAEGKRPTVSSEAATTEIHRLLGHISEDDSLSALSELVCYVPVPSTPVAKPQSAASVRRAEPKPAAPPPSVRVHAPAAPAVAPTVAAAPPVVVPPSARPAPPTPAAPIAAPPSRVREPERIAPAARVVAPPIDDAKQAAPVVAPPAAPAIAIRPARPAPLAPTATHVPTMVPTAPIATPAPVAAVPTPSPIPVVAAPPTPVEIVPTPPVVAQPIVPFAKVEAPRPTHSAAPLPSGSPVPIAPAQLQRSAATVVVAPPRVPVAPAVTLPIPPAIAAPTLLKIKEEPPPGYAPPRRPEAANFENSGPSSSLTFLSSGGDNGSSRSLRWKMIAAAAVIVMSVGVFAGRDYLLGRAEPVAAESTPTPVPAPASAPASTGVLAIDSQPAGAKVTLDGKEVGVTPLTLNAVSVGRHQVTLTSGEAVVQRGIRVEAGKQATINVPVFSGWVAIFAPIKLDVSEGRRSLGSTDTGRILLSPGRHVLTLSNAELGYNTSETVEISPGEERVLNLRPTGRVNVNASPWAEVWVDGTRAGETPLANLEVPLGMREFVFKHPQLGERRLTATVTTTASALSVDFGRPPSKP